MEDPQKTYLIFAVALIITISFGFWLLLSPGSDLTGRFVTQSPAPKECGGAVACNCGDNLTASRTLDGTDTVVQCGGNGLNIVADDVTLDCDGIFIEGSSTTNGIHIERNDGITIQNCGVRGFGTGIYVEEADDITIRDSFVTKNSEDVTGISFSEEVTNSLIENTWVNKNNVGIRLGPDSNNNVLRNNNVTYNELDGIVIDDLCTGNTITGGNVYENNQGGYIETGGITVYGSSNTVTGVTLYSNNGAGIYIEDGASNTIDGNTINDSTPAVTTLSLPPSDGIVVETSDNNIIKNNEIRNNTRYGILVEDSSGTQILTNDIIENGASAIAIIGAAGMASDHTIKGNIITNNGVNGYDNEYCPSDSCSAGIKLIEEQTSTIQGNTITHPYFGVYLYNSYDNEVLGNTITDSQQGIRVVGSGMEVMTPSLGGGHNTISNNILIDNYPLGIHIASEYNTISGNTISRPGVLGPATAEFDTQGAPPTGIYLNKINFDPTGNVLTGNDVQHYERGFVADSVSDFTMVNDNYYNNNRGIYLVNSNGCTITETNAYNNCINGMIMSESDATIIDSDFSDNAPTACSLATAAPLIYAGLYMSTATINLVNSDFENNFDWGLFEQTYRTVNWILTENVRCTNNDINISGSIVPLGGKIIRTDCNIWLNGKLLNAAKGQTGGIKIPLNTNNPGQTDTIGNASTGVELEVHTKTEFIGNVSVEFFDQNPGGNGFFLTGIGQWVNVTTSGPIDIDWMILKVYYGDNDVRGFTESSLRLEYYNATSGAWEKFDPPKGGVNTAMNYVWANITHFSIFGVGGTRTTTDTSGGGSSGPYEKDIGDIFEGVSFQSKIDETVYFQKDDNGYTLVVQAITPLGATINIGGTIVVLQSGMMQDLDLNGNGQTDAQLKVTSVHGSIVNMFLEQVDETGAVPAVEPVKIPIVEKKETPKTPVEEIVDKEVEMPDPIEPVEMAKPKLVQQPTVVEEDGLSMATIISLIVGFLVIAGLIIFTVVTHKKEPPKTDEKLEIPENIDDIPAPTVRQPTEPQAEQPKPEQPSEPAPTAPAPAEPKPDEVPKPDEIPKAFGDVEVKQPEQQSELPKF